MPFCDPAQRARFGLVFINSSADFAAEDLALSAVRESLLAAGTVLGDSDRKGRKRVRTMSWKIGTARGFAAGFVDDWNLKEQWCLTGAVERGNGTAGKLTVVMGNDGSVDATARGKKGRRRADDEGRDLQ
jgi:hypothetical protein